MNTFRYHLVSFFSDILIAILGIFGHLLFIALSPILFVAGYFQKKRFPNPKSIVITGASNGIGKELAIEYARTGVTNICLTGRDKLRLEEVADICKEKGANVDIGLIDVTNKDAMKQWLEQMDRKYTIDLVIANAGVTEILLPNSMTYEEKVYKVGEINMNGILNTIFPLLNAFRERKNGQIVLTSSISSLVPFVLPAYCGSKYWVTGYGACLRQELASWGIGVTVLVPGFVRTQMADTIEMAQPFVKKPEVSAKIFVEHIKQNPALATDNRSLLYLVNVLNKIQQPNFRDGYMFIQNALWKDGGEKTVQMIKNKINTNQKHVDLKDTSFIVACGKTSSTTYLCHLNAKGGVFACLRLLDFYFLPLKMHSLLLIAFYLVLLTTPQYIGEYVFCGYNSLVHQQKL
ncbi:short-chain dehydrogenase/reductase family protein [Heterostelium album PN500]|uniref:Short-chain dehydrogenase/reductase family protein n=1 Tax=Heterostelium pallidum (strain ATCC 26659 / Pp 5 / PN500) TaxID=670386 RepID=D3B146_HETP5|nr:short-chain dehydrogenase/reductase family protein [Heterostelium album PN500]EFA85020.1 short-chain dehydrogenase/reductase family protein [Heterostelium album PN500]|eukprot:XP_020437130.1 short-chain dehydrogenase/reductase family protein [Heterostelium album PN500]